GCTRRAAYFAFPNLYLELAMLRQSQRQLREFTRRGTAEIAADLRLEALARGRDPAAAAARFAELAPGIREDVACGMLSEQRIIDSCIEPDRLERALGQDASAFPEAWSRTEESLDRLQNSAHRDGAQLVIVAIPAPFQVDHRSVEFHRSLGYQ